MKQYAQALEWQAEARQEGAMRAKQDALLCLLEGRFKKVPVALASRIKEVENLDQLDSWFQAAINITSLQEFRKLLSQA